MKSSALALLLAGLCGGLVAAFVTLAMNRDPGRVSTSDLPLVISGSSETGAPRESTRSREITPTESQSPWDAIDLRLQSLEQSANKPERQTLLDSTFATQLGEIAARVDALEKAMKEKSSVEVPKDVLAETLAEVRKDEFVEKIEQYQEDRAARLEDDLVKMRDWLELDDYQADEMRVALQLQYDREQEQMRIWKETGDDATAGELKKADGELFAEDLSRFLTPEQSETFWTTISGGGGKSGK